MGTDKYSLSSPLKVIAPGIKVTFSFLIILSCLLGNSIYLSWVIFTLVAGIILHVNKTPFKILVRMLTPPAVFLIIGVLAVAFEISDSNEGMFLSFFILKKFVGTTGESILKAGRLFSKSLTSVCALYFLTLSTPLNDILVFLRRIKIPSLLTELMGLMYRFIFLISDSFSEVRTSQDSRLGYINLRRSLKSMASLITSTLIKSLRRSSELYTALEARCYTGTINVISKEYTRDLRLNFMFFFVNLFSFILLFLSLKNSWR